MATRGALLAYVCRVVRFSLARCILIRISVIPSDMGDGSFAVFKRSNPTSLCCYESYEDDVDYFIVNGA
jgi:hypothetical protein